MDEKVELDIHNFRKLCIKLKEVEDLIKELHSLMEKVKLCEVKDDDKGNASN